MGGRLEGWEQAAPLLELALDGFCDISDVERELSEGRAQLWPLGKSAVVTQVVERGRQRVLRVWLAGGNLHQLRRAAASLDEIASNLGCTSVEIDGRRGWKKVLEPFGFEEKRITLVKEVPRHGSTGE